MFFFCVMSGFGATCEIQRKLLNVITVGEKETDNNKQLIIIRE